MVILSGIGRVERKGVHAAREISGQLEILQSRTRGQRGACKGGKGAN